jgi:hypothetical protein
MPLYALSFPLDRGRADPRDFGRFENSAFKMFSIHAVKSDFAETVK